VTTTTRHLRVLTHNNGAQQPLQDSGKSWEPFAISYLHLEFAAIFGRFDSAQTQTHDLEDLDNSTTRRRRQLQQKLPNINVI
jgi:hypothetical protein